jgi:hypothetical protein
VGAIKMKGYRGRILLAGDSSDRCELFLHTHPENRSYALARAARVRRINLQANFRIRVTGIGSHGEEGDQDLRVTPYGLVLGNCEARGSQSLNEDLLGIARHCEERSIVVACLNV